MSAKPTPSPQTPRPWGRAGCPAGIRFPLCNVLAPVHGE